MLRFDRLNWVRKQAFDPDIRGLLANPFYFTRLAMAKLIKKQSPHLSGKLLDVGCGIKPYQKHLTKVTEYIGMEFDSEENRKHKKADVFYDGKFFPFADSSFDAILCTEVLEHVLEAEFFLQEIKRVLKPGGTLLLTVPFIWDEHEQPFDFRRFTSFGLKKLFTELDFKILEQGKSCIGIEAIVQLTCAYIYKVIKLQDHVLAYYLRCLLCFPINVIGYILVKILPFDSDLYLDNYILAKVVA